MIISKQLHTQFDQVLSHVKNSSNILDCSGAATMVIHKDKIVLEEYWGTHSKAADSRPIQEDSQFHIASVRKSYIGFAVAYAVHHGYIESIDDVITKYLALPDQAIFENTTLRHLLTHTHGLRTDDGKIVREFLPGESWAYRDINIEMLTDIVKQTTGKSVADILKEQVFTPLEFEETGWHNQPNETLVDVTREDNDRFWSTGSSEDGDGKNMYVSTRELAYWGYIHLKKGFINGKHVVSKDIIELATTLQSREHSDKDLPQNGFLWFVKDLPALKTEIGELVPKGSFQILGYSSVALLVIPKHEVVAVRMFNSWGSTAGYDYLADIRGFGDAVMKCL